MLLQLFLSLFPPPPHSKRRSSRWLCWKWDWIDSNPVPSWVALVQGLWLMPQLLPNQVNLDAPVSLLGQYPWRYLRSRNLRFCLVLKCASPCLSICMSVAKSCPQRGCKVIERPVWDCPVLHTVVFSRPTSGCSWAHWASWCHIWAKI